MARIDWIELRLQNWARWRVAGGGTGVMGYSSVSLGNSVNAGRSGYVTAAIPIMEAEAAATDDAVRQLQPLGLALTLDAVYCGTGSIADAARQLCCARITVYARIDQAHAQLAGHFLAQQDRQRAERLRLEALLQAGSFPR